MTYGETTQWLFNQLPMFQRQGAAAYKVDLMGTWRVLDMLGRPDLALHNVIHVAGTNGKGSVCTAIAHSLTEQGFKVGLFTSPHLEDFRERMRVNGSMPPEQWVVDFVAKHVSIVESQTDRPSFFEWTFGMALSWFAESQVDFVVLETGMGGRLDSTNVFEKPLLAVITNVGYDHQQFLGNDIRSIAAEKAGIIKEGVPVVLGRMRPEAQSVMLQVANQRGAETHYAAAADLSDMERVGPHWPENRATAHKALEVLSEVYRERKLQVPPVHALSKAEHLGRWQWISIQNDHRKALLDCAHNVDGIQSTLKAVESIPKDRLHIVFGTVADKNLDEVFAHLPKHATYHFCAAQIPRALAAGKTLELAREVGMDGFAYETVCEAFNAAAEEAGENDLVLVIGSIFIAAEVLQCARN
ncbi:MAG: Mur ligase family protein [Bacteroidetes bacterium]|nr:Mur ligase family protein [Bacteroidota bacterium]